MIAAVSAELETEGNEPLVTVVIPAYNAERTLAECLNSISNQRYRNLEIIVVDDQSTDGTAHIAHTYAENDDRVQVIHKNNAGPGAARNDGLRMAQGKYLQFVDADDVLEPAAIATTVDIAEHTQADLVSFDFKLFSNGHEVSRSGAVPLAYPEITQSSGVECLKQIYTGHLGYFSWAFLYRLDAVRASGMQYPEDVHLLEDMFMLNRLLRHDLNVAYRAKQLYGYRNNPGSLSHASGSARAMQGLKVVTAVERMCKPDDLQLYAQSAVPVLLYLDSLLPTGSPDHRLLRSEARRMASIAGIGKLERRVLLRLALTSTGFMDVIRRMRNRSR